MSVTAQLLKIAHQFADQVHTRARSLEPELQKLDARKLEIEEELHAANLSQQRLASFVPEIGRDLQCPHCWLQDETQSSLRPLSAPTPRNSLNVVNVTLNSPCLYSLA